MKTPRTLTAMLAAAFVLSSIFPVSAAETGKIPEVPVTEQENAVMSGKEKTVAVSLPEKTTVSGNTAVPDDGAGFPVPDEAPPFHAHIEFRMGYTVIGTFTDFTPDIIQILPLYSWDGENWQTGTREWNLFQLNTDDEYKLKGLQNQSCFYNADEPLKSYIAGEIDRFYLKLRITKENGISYETLSAAIERAGLTPLPEGCECRACFSSSVAVKEPAPTAPFRYRSYARYQITVSENATAEDISALLPDTLPVEIQLDNGPDFIAIGTIELPVKWKPLSLPPLSAGESLTIPDAAEELLVPAGTLVSTPMGIFPLEEPLSLDTPPSTGEVRLVLNVCAKDQNPTGVLKNDRDGLKISLRQKPTGAASIQAYVLTEGESKWTELPDLPLLKEMNAQPSTENSGFALVLRNDREPLRSYLAAEEAGTAPTPFFIGLKIEGGVYDGRQLVLAWPDIYDTLPDLPEITGGEGNEGNAGADNKDDSTESGQRPNLPQPPDDIQEGQFPVPAPGSDDSHGDTPQTPSSPDGSHGNTPQTPPSPDGSHGDTPQTPPSPDGSHGKLPQTTTPTLNENHGEPTHATADTSDDSHRKLTKITADTPNDSHGEPTQITADTPNGSHGKPTQITANTPNDSHGEPTQITADTPNDSHGELPQATAPSRNNDLIWQQQTTAPSPNHGNRFPLLMAATAIALCCCIGAAACKTAGYRLPYRIAGKIRNLLQK